MPPYTDLFIDFDDTLYDTRKCAEKSIEALYALRGFDKYFPTAEDFRNAYMHWNVLLWGKYAKGEITKETLVVERFRQPLLTGNIEKENVDDKFCLGLSDQFLGLTIANPVAVEGAHDLLDYLKEKGYKLHICSNGFSEVQHKKIHNIAMDSYFTSIVLSEDAGANKPSKQFFDYAMKLSGAQKETTLMIGDNYNTDIEGAMNYGIDTMLFNRWDCNFVPPQPVNYTVNSLSEIKEIL